MFSRALAPTNGGAPGGIGGGLVSAPQRAQQYSVEAHDGFNVPSEESREGLGPVGVFEHPDHIEPLIKAVKQMNYAVLTGADIANGCLSQMNERLTAAIVSDAIEASLDLCASILPNTPKILIASDASFSFRLAAARAGVSAILSRPLNVNELADWLEHFESERSATTASILIVDDDLLTAEFHAEVLRVAGMQVNVLSDPVVALNAIATTPPDLILMDVQMPGVDGIELARVIRQSRQHLAVPIVFLSAERDMSRQIEARKFGGDVFIKKPIDPQQLVSIVRLRADRARILRSMIEHDSLTGLYNHGRFKDRLIHEFERSRRTGTELSLAMIDIDHFKRVNDAHGHPVGDRVIRALSNLLASGLRKIDIVGRYGGEEFGVLLLDTPLHAAQTVIDNLRLKFSNIPFDASGQPFGATFSAGIAGVSVDASPQQLIANADAALYVAKRAGRNRVELAAM
jgi:diguanylate cyclase (GGDEF)-like protein